MFLHSLTELTAREHCVKLEHVPLQHTKATLSPSLVLLDC
jgi:hypothetical protein